MSKRRRNAGERADDLLEVRLLGGFGLARRGQVLGHDLSRKTRALLGYLVAVGRAEQRRTLCDLFWQGPDDPRGSLRWSLSRIRKALGADATRIHTDGDLVGFSVAGTNVDWHAARTLVGASAESAATADLQAAAALMRGELLAGLDLDDCFGYQTWCLAERETARTMRLGVLRALVSRLTDEPERALSYARAWLTADPLSEPGHAALMRLLAAMGRQREVLEHYELCRRLLETELGTSPSAEIEAVRMSLRTGGRGGPLATRTQALSPPVIHSTEDQRITVGRTAELDAIVARLECAKRGEPGSILLIVGEPGLGKSHLLALVGKFARGMSARVLHGRAFEAETGRAFGPWIEALGGDIEAGLPFAAIADRLRPSGTQLTVLTLDDLQWADEASIALLHFVARTLADDPRFVIAIAARPGELADNRPATRLTAALRRERRLVTLTLPPLSDADVQALAATVVPAMDARWVIELSQGNPLFAHELARAFARGDTALPDTLEQMIADHLDRLSPLTQAILPWMAALGRGFDVGLLGRLCPWPAADLLMALDELERHGVIRAHAAGSDGVGYDFAHDLHRLGAYRRLSGPRRRLVHAQIAGALGAVEDPAGVWAAELARHAALGGAPMLAARACLAAGERCQRLLAPGDAGAFSDRGLGHLAGMEARTATAITLRIALLRLKVQCGAARGDQATRDTEAALLDAIAMADASALLGEVATGHYALSVLHQQRGELDRARLDTLRAEAAGRAADAATAARQKANTARCLAQLERDIGRARQLADEARSMAVRFELDEVELLWAEGLLHRWDGRPENAASALEQAAALASEQGDRQREHGARVALLMLDLERGRTSAVREACRTLLPLSRKLGVPEVAQVEALRALAAAAAGDPGAMEELEPALDGLRSVDSKAPLSYALAMAAQIAFEQDAIQLAARLAAEAREAAETMELGSEAALAIVVQARVALAEGDGARARELLRPLSRTVPEAAAFSAHCRSSIATAIRTVDSSSRAAEEIGGKS